MLVIAPNPDQLYIKVEAFLATVVPTGTPTIRGLDNRTAMPAEGFVLFQLLFQQRLRTNVETDEDPFPDPDPGSVAIEQGTQVDMQLDFYGPNSAAWAAMVSTVWRSDYGCRLLAPDCQPLYIDDARMVPLIPGEEQYVERWCSRGVLQWNPVTSVPQEFAGAASVDIINVDASYPP